MPQPTLIVIDIQKEYQTPGRPYFIPGVEKSLAKAKSVLEIARAKSWNVLHVRHVQDGEIFNRDSELSQFILGFEPQPNECVFLKGDYSCYSSPEFTKKMETLLDSETYVVGYGSTKCCLSTIVDGYHRGQKFIFVEDASNAKPEPGIEHAALHHAATTIIKSFSKVISTVSLG